MSKKEGKQKDVVSMRRKRTMSTYSRETKEFKNKLISKVAWKKAKNNSVLLYMDVVLKELQKRDDRMVISSGNHVFFLMKLPFKNDDILHFNPSVTLTISYRF